MVSFPGLIIEYASVSKTVLIWLLVNFSTNLCIPLLLSDIISYFQHALKWSYFLIFLSYDDRVLKQFGMPVVRSWLGKVEEMPRNIVNKIK